MPQQVTTLTTPTPGTIDLLGASEDPTRLRLAIAGFLSAYRGSTLIGYRYDLNLYLTWCADPDHQIDPLDAKRGHLELYKRWMEQTGWASATIAKRYDTVRGFYRAADRDDLLTGKDPCTWRHASPNTTGIYIRDGKSHDRNSTHRVASFVAGMAG